MFAVHKSLYAYNIELYGSDYNSVEYHIVRRSLGLKVKPTDVASVFVFVDEGFPVEAVENVFTSFGTACHSTCIMLTQPKIIKPHYYTLKRTFGHVEKCMFIPAC